MFGFVGLDGWLGLEANLALVVPVPGLGLSVCLCVCVSSHGPGCRRIAEIVSLELGSEE